MGAAGGDLATRGRRLAGDRGPALLRAPRAGPAPHRGRCHQHLARATARRLDTDAAAGAQLVPGGDRPRADAGAQGARGHHRLEDRARLRQGRHPRDLPEHGALSLQHLRHRDGGAHLLRQAGARAGRAGERHPGGHAQGDHLVQPGAQPGARPRTAQRRAGADGAHRRAGAGAPRAAQGHTAAGEVRAPRRAVRARRRISRCCCGAG